MICQCVSGNFILKPSSQCYRTNFAVVKSYIFPLIIMTHFSNYTIIYKSRPLTYLDKCLTEGKLQYLLHSHTNYKKPNREQVEYLSRYAVFDISSRIGKTSLRTENEFTIMMHNVMNNNLI